MLNKQKGNMYPWTTHTWNPIRGRCPHECTYCYMKGFNVGELRLDEKSLEDNLGEGRTIFVGSSTDMWAQKVPAEWIEKVLKHCDKSPNNTYLFQTKNPSRYYDFIKDIPLGVLGITFETNRFYQWISKAPLPQFRILHFIGCPLNDLSERMISIEPVLDFDLDIMIEEIRNTEPLFVSIGADSKGHNLPEPPPEKIKELISELEKFTAIKIKKNLGRLLKPEKASPNI